MLFMLSVATLCASALVFAWAFGQHRRPQPAAWTRLPMVSSGLCVALVGMFPAGLGLMVLAFDAGLSSLAAEFTYVTICAAMTIGTIFLVPRLTAPGRTKFITLTESINPPPAANTAKAPGRKARRRAA